MLTITDAEAAGPHDPHTPAPRRPRAAVRRTTSIDTHRPEGILGPPVIEARGRDLWTAADGRGTVVDLAHIAADLDGRQHHLTRIESDPEVERMRHHGRFGDHPPPLQKRRTCLGNSRTLSGFST